MYKKSNVILFIAAICLLFSPKLLAQNQVNVNELGTTSVPFLNYSPESRAGGMGDAGVATLPDVNSQHWNSSKYAFLEQDMGASLSYTPWLRNLVSDMNLLYLSYFKRIDKLQTLSASLRYFSMGDVDITDDTGQSINTGRPNEFALDVAYSRLLSDKFSMSVALRYIRSDLYGGAGAGLENSQAGNAFAADINAYYLQSVKWFGLRGDVSAGLNFSNIGSKISYDGGASEEFLPANMRLGVAYSIQLDNYNTLGFAVDMNKIMIAQGEDNEDISVPSSIFKSFGDADIENFMFQMGLEYWYNKQFAVRTGYSHQSEELGNNKFVTAGAGVKFSMFSLDLSYIIPTVKNSPMANTVRFTLGFDFDEVTGQHSDYVR